MAANYRSGDTIFALSSAPGRAGVAVLRISGAKAADCLIQLSGSLPRARHASLRHFRDANGEEIDQGLALWFPAPKSFTGEDGAEIHLHGSRAVIEAMLSRLGGLAGLRLAEPGEFTRRAVEGGKFDLVEAEGLADLINADTEGQRKQALRQFGGGLTELYESWRVQLIRAVALAESAIDFSEEELPTTLRDDISKLISSILLSIQQHLEHSSRGELIREGLTLTVIGPPNAGKSSFINALSQKDIAIVSDIPGTTRDVIEVRLNLGGYLVVAADTAGLTATNDRLEKEGVARAIKQAERSDLTLLLQDGSLQDDAAFAWPQVDLFVWNKADLSWPKERSGHKISLKTAEGVGELIEVIVSEVKSRLEKKSDSPPLTRLRHRRALEDAVAALNRADAASGFEFVAEDLRMAIRELGRITGRVDVEDVLDVIFKEFCIGK